MRLYENNCNISLFLQIDDLLNFLTQSTQLIQTVLKCNKIISCTNIIATIENFVALKKINYVCMASSQNRSILPNLPIAVNLSEYEKRLCFLCKGEKASHSSFYEDE